MPSKKIMLPDLLDSQHRNWTVREAHIRKAGVDLETAEAFVPRPLTYSARLARLHELGHVKYSPHQWRRMVTRAMSWAEANDEDIDPGIALQIAKMLEENRVDFLLWARHRIDIRPAREVFEWSAMPIPEQPLDALRWVLQLMWTVWASRGLGRITKNRPPKREPDKDTAVFFDACWQVVLDHPKGTELAEALVSACMEIYNAGSPKDTDRARDIGAAELSTFFKVDEPPPPEEKEEEKEEREEAEAQEEKEESQLQKAKEEEERGGAGSEPTRIGIILLHDHTKSLRKTSTRIARRDTPTDMGIRLRYPQRYLMDKAIFGWRTLSQAALMIDGSGSMRWTNEALKELVSLMPAIWVGIYSGHEDIPWLLGKKKNHEVFGQVCVLAKDGRLAKYEGLCSGMNMGNEIDVPALRFLTRQPGPHFWLSDGQVCGGPDNHKPHPVLGAATPLLEAYGKIMYDTDRLMKQHGVLRVPDMATMVAMLKRRPVTLYKSCVNWNMARGLEEDGVTSLGPRWDNMSPEERETMRRSSFPDSMPEEPVRFQL